MARAKIASHRLVDDAGNGEIAVVRCPDGAIDVFYDHAAVWMDREGYDRDEFEAAPPMWRLFRMNPCNDGEHAWDLGRPDKKGPGTWMGAIVKVVKKVS